MPRQIRIHGCSVRPSKRRCVKNTSGIIDKECRIVNKRCTYDPDYHPSPRRKILKKTEYVPIIRPEHIPLLNGCKYTSRQKTDKLGARTYCKTTKESTIDSRCKLSSKNRCLLDK